MRNRRIRYDVEVVGDAAPFKWQVKRTGDYNMTPVLVNECKGEADTFTDALFDAAECARRFEEKRRHSDTKRTEHLFEVGPTDEDDDEER